MPSNAPSPCDVSPCHDTWIPEGYVLVVGPNEIKYIVPEFILPALDQDFHAGVRKEKIGAFRAPGTVSLAQICLDTA
jgi:hypothetical protein